MDQKAIPLGHIQADDTGSIPFSRKSEASAVAVKLPKYVLSVSYISEWFFYR